MRRLTSGLRRWAAAAPANVGLGVLSLAIAAVIWVMVTNSENPVVTRDVTDVHIQTVSVPRQYIAGSIAPDRITVTLTGPGNLLADIRQDELEASVDLSGVADDSSTTPSITVTRPVRVNVRGLRDRRVRAESSVEQATVQLERQESKEVPVQVREVGVLPVGIDKDAITVDPPTAIVTGAPGNVRAVEAAVADIKLDGQTVSFSQSVALDARDSSGRTIGGVTAQPANASVTAKLRQVLYPKQVAVVVNWRGRPKTGYDVTSVSVNPAGVTVVGRLDQINNLSGVSTEVVDIEGATADVVRTVRLQLPGVTTNQDSVVVTIGIQTVRAPASMPATPRVVNLQPGLVATLTTPVVALNLSGPLADIVQLRPTDVSVTVDASGLGPGSYKLDPKATYPPALQLDAVVPEKVEVTISRAPGP